MRRTVFVAAAQKCGSTTTYFLLKDHPDISGAVDPGNREPVKEPRHFASPEVMTLPQWAKHYCEAPQGNFWLDATPCVFDFPGAVERILAFDPAAKFICTYRDPVKRLLSAYNHYVQDWPSSRNWFRVEGDPLATLIEDELAGMAEGDASCLRGLLGRGYYADRLERGLAKIPRENIYLDVLEEWTGDKQSYLNRLTDFLGISRVVAKPDIFQHQREHTVPHPDRKLIDWLYEHYATHNERFFKLLGRRIDSWSGPA